MDTLIFTIAIMATAAISAWTMGVMAAAAVVGFRIALKALNEPPPTLLNVQVTLNNHNLPRMELFEFPARPLPDESWPDTLNETPKTPD